MRSQSKRLTLFQLLVIGLLAVPLFAGCGSNDALDNAALADVEYVIEPGSLARQLRGQTVELIPNEIELVVGQKLVIHNEDQALHYFLSTPVWPGEVFTKTFSEPGVYRYSGAFTCSIGSSNSLTVLVNDSTLESVKQ